MPFLGVTFPDLITPVTVLVTTLVAYLLISRKERSLKLWVTSLLQLEGDQAKNWVETFATKQIEIGSGQLIELKTELSTWSMAQIEALRNWMIEQLPAIGEKLVKEPISELLTSEKFSILGKLSGNKRGADAVINAVAEETMPEDMKFLRDQLIDRFPRLKKTLKNPGQIMELAQRFGINIGDFVGNGDKESGESKSRW